MMMGVNNGLTGFQAFKLTQLKTAHLHSHSGLI